MWREKYRRNKSSYAESTRKARKENTGEDKNLNLSRTISTSSRKTSVSPCKRSADYKRTLSISNPLTNNLKRIEMSVKPEILTEKAEGELTSKTKI